jgi:hypothetical protein
MTKKKAKKKPMKKTKLPHKDLHHLTMILKYTELSINNDGSDMDQVFKSQADRIKKQIEGLG